MDKFDKFVNADYFYIVRGIKGKAIAMSKPLYVSDDKVSLLRTDNYPLVITRKEFNSDKYIIECINLETGKTVYNSINYQMQKVE